MEKNRELAYPLVNIRKYAKPVYFLEYRERIGGGSGNEFIIMEMGGLNAEPPKADERFNSQ